jgi:hypothetical protein
LENEKCDGTEVYGRTNPHDADWKMKLRLLNEQPIEEIKELYGYACKVAEKFKSVGGEWSIDFLWTKNGWYAIDMAVAQDSWGWDL